MELERQYEEANALIQKGRYQEAISLLNGILSEFPEHYFAMNKKGAALAMAGQLEQAEECFSACLNINSHYTPAIVNIGNIHKQRGDMVAAVECYQKGIDEDPEYYFSYYNLACIYKERRNYTKYFEYLKKYKRKYKYHLSTQKQEQSIGIEKSKKYTAALIYAAIILGLIFIASRF